MRPRAESGGVLTKQHGCDEVTPLTYWNFTNSTDHARHPDTEILPSLQDAGTYFS